MWKLVIEDDEGKRTVVPLTRDDYTIGRKEGNTIRLTERNVSREHAKLRRHKANGAGSPVQYMLEDCTSYNGVYVNGLRVASTQELVHGDLIQIGDYRMVLQDDQVVEQPTAVPSISADSKATIPTGAMNRGQGLMERPNRLVMLAGPTPGAEYPLDRDRLTVGRAEDATISVNHNSVSRLHCEIHLLGEGRYEIVDKGSSNGVRVNSAELKRGIVEAGDLIELGDVRFKFVGAGQIFLPGVNDSTQFSTIADRVVPPKQERRSGILPYVLLGAFVAGALVFAWAYFQHKGAQQQPSGPPATITSESQFTKDLSIVDAARALADKGDFAGAHAKLAEVTNDTVRASPDYQATERRWAEDALARAEAMPSESADKRKLLTDVAQDTSLNMTTRTRANDAIATLDKAQAQVMMAPVVTGSPTATSDTTTTTAAPVMTAVAHREPPASARPRATQPTPSTESTATSTSSKPAGRSVSDQARAALLSNPQLTKELLMPLVLSGKASPDDIRTLKAACDGLKDRVCQDYLKGK